MPQTFSIHRFLIGFFLVVCLGFSSSTAKYEQVEYKNIFKIILQHPNDIIGLGEIHKVKDFNVIKTQLMDSIVKIFPTNLYFESGMNEVFVLRMKKNTPEQHLSKYIYFIWQTKEIDSLLMALNQKNGVNIFGIDVQPGNFEFTNYIDSVIKANHFPVYHFRQYDSTLVALSIKSQKNQFTKKDNSYLASIKDSLTVTYKKCIKIFQKSFNLFNTNNLKFLSLCMQNRINEINFIFTQNTDDVNKFVATRDSLMAVNFFSLDTLFNKNRSLKSVIWAHDGHIMRKQLKQESTNDNKLINKSHVRFLGEYIAQKYGKNYVSIGLSCDYINNGRIGKHRFITETEIPHSNLMQTNLYSSLDSTTRFNYILIKNRVSEQTYN